MGQVCLSIKFPIKYIEFKSKGGKNCESNNILKRLRLNHNLGNMIGHSWNQETFALKQIISQLETDDSPTQNYGSSGNKILAR